MNEPSRSRARRYFAPRFSLRTLLVAMLLLGPLGAVGWKEWQRWREWEAQRAADLEIQRERERAIANVRTAFSNMNGGIVLEADPSEIIQSDESFPESDPR
jgi:hypothetical protein